jgi:hypothetical protein
MVIEKLLRNDAVSDCENGTHEKDFEIDPPSASTTSNIRFPFIHASGSESHDDPVPVTAVLGRNSSHSVPSSRLAGSTSLKLWQSKFRQL